MGRRHGNSAESQKNKKAIDCLDSALKHNCATILERHLEDEEYQMRMHEQGYTQSDMEEFERIAIDKRDYVASSTERACHRDQYKVVQPNQGGGSDTAKTEEHFEYKQFQTIFRPEAKHWSSWSYGHGHSHQGLHDGILCRHKHGDSHHNMLHLMFQHSS